MGRARAWWLAARGLASCLAGLWLLGCDANAHIRLFEPGQETGPSGMDASRPGPETDADPDDPDPPDPPPPEAGPGGPRDAQPTPPLPDREPPRRDGGRPPVTSPEGGTPVGPSADALVLRYDFSGSGTVVRDLVGEADAELIGGATLSPDRGFVALDGKDDYVNIPNGVVSGLHSATFVAWVTWNGGFCWQRIFDFDINDQGEDEVGTVVTSLFMTPVACGREDVTAMVELGSVKLPVTGDGPMPSDRAVQVALVVDGDRKTLTLYLDTKNVGEADASFQLAQLGDFNNWLGRSQWPQDPFYSGLYGEFRIYSRVLSADEIAAIHAEGFDQ